MHISWTQELFGDEVNEVRAHLQRVLEDKLQLELGHHNEREAMVHDLTGFQVCPFAVTLQ